MQVPAAIAPVVDLFFPPRCPLCGAPLAEQVGLCAECWGAMAIPADPACAKCQRPFGEGVPEGAVCAPCLAEPPVHDGIAAATLYNEPARRLVLAFKRGGRVALAPFLGRLMAARLMHPGLPQAGAGWLVVPVPLHRWRLWARGYNQSALLGAAIARERGAALVVDGLVRRKATPVLGGLGARARERALAGAIAVNPRRAAQLRGADVVLVDDVLTSGATTEACVRVLKRAGAKRVVVACFSRVLNEALDHA
ncbi:ComF family protein [Novosphingobium bradum]|uniref:ComF family protein n=1 Tax=Novosphingobium bradum TaxID=1737444 RepID=A0ABV7IW28_9SPHN